MGVYQWVCVVIYLCFTSCLCTSKEATAGFLFSCELTRNEGIPSDAEVEFSVSLLGHPGLPTWLTFLQVDNLSPAYIYGTPDIENIGTITLEVRAMRMDTFVTDARQLDIIIMSLEGDILQRADFYVRNYSTDELLDPELELQERFTAALADVFQNPDARITQIFHPSARDIAVPALPMKHGVIVEATPGINVDTIAKATQEQADPVQGDCSSEDVFELPPVNFELFAERGFEIDWCSFQTYTAEGEREILEETDESSYVSRPSSEGSNVPLIVIVVVCLVVVVMAVTGLACIFFGGRKRAFYISYVTQAKKEIMTLHAVESSSGPAVAQKHLRDLAQAPRRRPASGNSEETATTEHLPEVTDVTLDRERSPPPPYSYPEELLRRPLQTHQV